MPGCNLFTPGVRKGKVNRRLAVDDFDTMLQLKNEHFGVAITSRASSLTWLECVGCLTGQNGNVGGA